MGAEEGSHPLVEALAKTMLLGEGMQMMHAIFGDYTLLEHWLQGEFHHDLVFHVPNAGAKLPGAYLVIATNCNGGIKEVLCLPRPPERWALWNHRCPENPEFEGDLGEVLACATTSHWFDPCELLVEDARSEMREEHRERQRGGGWKMKGSTTE